MALKFFAVLTAVAGTGIWFVSVGGANQSDDAAAIFYGFILWLVAVVLFAFGDVVQNLKVIAEGITVIADNSEAWVEEELVEED